MNKPKSNYRSKNEKVKKKTTSSQDDIIIDQELTP